MAPWLMDDQDGKVEVQQQTNIFGGISRLPGEFRVLLARLLPLLRL